MSHADETRAAAQQLDHPWDRRALEWPLTKDSVVVEAGGYKGRWALQIAERYQPWLYVFEPQPWAVMVCREVLRDRATVLPYAIGVHDAILPMGEWETDGCSFVKPGNTPVKMREIWSAFDDLKLDHIDLLLMNIEGYEYTLLPHMLDKGILPDRLMAQFHTFADTTGMQTAAIFDRLEQAGYRVAWTYGTVLTAWERL